MKYLKFTIVLVMLVFATSGFTADPTVTYAALSAANTYYNTSHSASWTATTGVDSVVILSSTGKPFFIGDLSSTAKPIRIQVESNSSAASTVSKIFVWFVSNNPIASLSTDITTTATTLAFTKDWNEAKRDTVADNLAPAATFDVDSYSGLYMCCLIYEPTETDEAVAEVARTFLPRRESEF
jgi:hypothetical protein